MTVQQTGKNDSNSCRMMASNDGVCDGSVFWGHMCPEMCLCFAWPRSVCAILHRRSTYSQHSRRRRTNGKPTRQTTNINPLFAFHFTHKFPNCIPREHPFTRRSSDQQTIDENMRSVQRIHKLHCCNVSEQFAANFSSVLTYTYISVEQTHIKQYHTIYTAHEFRLIPR